MSAIVKMAQGMTDFAAGVYKGLDGGGTKRLINRTASNISKNSGVAMKEATETATKQINHRVGTMGGKIGTSATKLAPVQGLAGTAQNYMQTPQSQRNLMNSLKAGHMNSAGKMDVKKIAGTAATVGVAGRVATGGGLYRDRYGNVNIPGVPFI